MTHPREILPTLDQDDVLWASAAYVLWPFVWFAMLFSPRREVPFVRFHVFQATAFGLVTSFLFLAFTGVVLIFFRSSGAQSMSLGLVFVVIFGVWLVVLLAWFLWFVYLAWRAGKGDVMKLPILGDMAENWALAVDQNVL